MFGENFTFNELYKMFWASRDWMKPYNTPKGFCWYFNVDRADFDMWRKKNNAPETIRRFMIVYLWEHGLARSDDVLEDS